METETKKMEWSKPILEELGRARYSLGSPCGFGNFNPESCVPGGTGAPPPCVTGPGGFGNPS